MIPVFLNHESHHRHSNAWGLWDPTPPKSETYLQSKMSARQLARLRALVEEKKRQEEEAEQEEDENEEEYCEEQPRMSFSVLILLDASFLGIGILR